MRIRPLTESRWTRSVVVATIILFAAAGFCMFEGDHDDDHVGPLHGCLAMLTTVVRIAVIELLVIGGATTLAGFGLPLVTLRVPVPPPKLAVS
jgi:hypothetical protein